MDWRLSGGRLGSHWLMGVKVGLPSCLENNCRQLNNSNRVRKDFYVQCEKLP